MSFATESRRSVIAPVVGMGWLHNGRFDVTFIGGIALLALAAGLTVVAVPSLFWPVLMADLWLLGYHHVIATWTRLALDRASVGHHRFLVYVLPPVVIAATATLGWIGGLGAIGTVYFYWQWFHYTRQSWGVIRAYGRKAHGNDQPSPCSGPLFAAFFFGVPAWGILRRMAEAPESFLNIPFYTLPLPMVAADAIGTLALFAGAVWLAEIWRGRRALLSPAEVFYLLAHFAVFVTGYVLIRDINHGWLVVNIWHNAQYILFVWLYNRRRFKDGVQPDARVLSWLSQPGRAGIYLAACLGLSTIVYLAILGGSSGLAMWALPASVVFFQAINFHHYIVDGLIWKGAARKPPPATP